MARPHEILEFWFGAGPESPESLDARTSLWFGRDAGFDRRIRERFGPLVEAAGRGELDRWMEHPDSALALVLLLDQFPRNLHRGTARAFELDPAARRIALEAIERGFDRALPPTRASFLYLPLEHAEDPGLQDRCVELFESLARRAPGPLRPVFERFTDFARRHREVVRRFGRFPHRNAILGRPSTAEEEIYLREGGDTFG